ncbi:MAG: GDYXXLXY domain-containing protein [Spirochaetota bacterium]
MKNKKLLILALAGIPWIVLAGMVVKAYLPIFTGRSYLLPVKARDPRDFFRGNYVSLQYDFSSVRFDAIRHDLVPGKDYRFGDILYLALREKEGALAVTGIYAENKPDSAILLKVQPAHSFRLEDKDASLSTGLESFFAPKTDALAWEDALRQGQVFARVSIDHSGNARLTGLELRSETR